jgi:serine/threonine protein kinase
VIVPGDVLHNRYRIERSIGRGGMGEVFCAVVLVPPVGRELDEEVTLLRPSLDSFRVAIKVVSRTVVSEAAMARLQREAVAASRIKSAFVPELIDVGTTDEGEVFLAMEILYGETLSARLKSRQCLYWEEVFQLGDDVLSGLIDAHEAGVVHRDLKPSNIFLCDRALPDMVERAKVLDFGVCKLDTHDEEHLTGTGESVGTASYMAPEQIRGASHVTERADLYSFATVMFEAVSGQLPHLGTGQMAMLASKLERSPLHVTEVAAVHVPEGLDALLDRLLARDTSKRYPSRECADGDRDGHRVGDARRRASQSVARRAGARGLLGDRLVRRHPRDDRLAACGAARPGGLHLGGRARGVRDGGRSPSRPRARPGARRRRRPR